MKPCDVWDELRGDQGSFHAWSCIRGAVESVRALITEARRTVQRCREKGHEDATVSVRFQWGRLADRESCSFVPHLSAAEFESVVSRLARFDGWGCVHAERAMYVVRHGMGGGGGGGRGGASQGLVVTTVSSARPPADGDGVCAAHGQRLAAEAGEAAAEGEWHVRHVVIHEAKSAVFEFPSMPTMACLRVLVEVVAPLPEQMERRMSVDVPLQCKMLSTREFWEGGLRYAVTVEFSAKGRTELDDLMRMHTGTHTVELVAEQPVLERIAAGRGAAYGAADLLMKAASMFTWPFLHVRDGSAPHLELVRTLPAARENNSFFRRQPTAHAPSRSSHDGDEDHEVPAAEEEGAADEEEEADGRGDGEPSRPHRSRAKRRRRGASVARA